MKDGLKKEVKRRTDKLKQSLSDKASSFNVFQYMYGYYIKAIEDMNLDPNTSDKLKHYFVYQHFLIY